VVILINGEKKQVSADTVEQLLKELGIRPGRVVVELNRDVIPREAHAATPLKEGDSVEIVHFVGGG